jgi:hypothetical protein
MRLLIFAGLHGEQISDLDLPVTLARRASLLSRGPKLSSEKAREVTTIL